MQQREKILAVLAAACIILWGGIPFFKRTFLTPIDDRQDEIERLDDEIGRQERAQFALRRARTNLRKWKKLSLPPDWRDAQRLYLEWITDLVKMTEFSDAKVAPARNLRPGKVFSPIRVSIEAKATYEQLCRFLDRFQKADLLHRIAELDIKKTEEKGKTSLAVSLVAEGLSLVGVEHRDRLLPQTKLKADISPTETTIEIADASEFPKHHAFLARCGSEILVVRTVAGTTWTVERAAEATSAAKHPTDETVELFHVIGKKSEPSSDQLNTVLAGNFFVKPSASEPVQDPLTSEYAKNTYLRSLIGVENEWEGWLYDPSNKMTILRKGTKFKILDLEVIVIGLQRDHVLLQAGDEKRRLKLGECLHAMEKVSDTPQAPSEEKTTLLQRRHWYQRDQIQNSSLSGPADKPARSLVVVSEIIIGTRNDSREPASKVQKSSARGRSAL